MKKISTKELYLVYLYKSSTPILARKKKDFQCEDIFTKKIYEIERYSSEVAFSSLIGAAPIITNLPYINEEIAHQIIEQKKFVLFDQNIKSKVRYDDKIALLPFVKITGREFYEFDRYHMPSYTFTYTDVFFYALAKYIDKDHMEDIFTQRLYEAHSFQLSIGECGYLFDYVKEFVPSSPETFEEEAIQLLQEKNKNQGYYMDVEYPQNKVKKLMKFIKK